MVAGTGASAGSAGNSSTRGAAPIASSTPVVAPKGFRSALQLMLQGWQELIPTAVAFPSSAGDVTQSEILSKLQGYLQAYQDLDTHVTAANLARARLESQEAEVRVFHATLTTLAAAYFGAHSPQLVKFGLKPRRARAALTSEQQAIRAARVMATRKLRGTMGRVQKAAIKSGPMALTVGPAEPVPAASTMASTAPLAVGPAPTARSDDYGPDG
jgi:hypothetical protein